MIELGEILLPTLRDETAKDGAPLLFALLRKWVGERFARCANAHLSAMIPREDGAPDVFADSFWCCGWSGFDGVVFAGEEGCGLEVGGGRVDGLCDFNAEYVTWTEHIAGDSCWLNLRC
jgi:hypothetical protein